MSLRFESTHSFLIKVLRRCGIKMPWFQMRSKLSAVLYFAYDCLLVLIGFYQFVFSGLSMMWVGNFQDVCNLVSITLTQLSGVLISIYFLLYQQKMVDLIENLNKLNLKILKNQLDSEGSFQTMYFKIARGNESFSKKILFLVFLTPVVYCTPVPLIDAARGSYRDNLPLPMLYPYDDHKPGLYELSFFLHVSGLVISVMKKIGNDCFFLSLFKIHTVYLRCLSASITGFKDKFVDKSDIFIKRQQIILIRFHSEIIRNANELVSMYAPVIIFYYYNLIMMVVFGLFTQIKNDRDNFIQGLGVGGFGIINVFQFYMICSAAEVLATEAERVALALYDMDWYQMNKSNTDLLKLMFLMAKNPGQVTAFRAQTYLLNKETFIGFITSAVTALMTFSKMDDIRQSMSLS